MNAELGFDAWHCRRAENSAFHCNGRFFSEFASAATA
jgi:hypothetical protein